MMKTLSDKEQCIACLEGVDAPHSCGGWFNILDVKAFIKELKDKIELKKKTHGYGERTKITYYADHRQVMEIINKLAGEKLVK